jgi:S-DNA-T family DNA segregation ATPase FtsK/SpoIIIE
MNPVEVYNVTMIPADIDAEAKFNELFDCINKLSERQNSQYTDMMMQLKELKDEIHSRHTHPAEGRTADELYEEAEDAVIEMGKASTSYLQRVLGIGYSRAAELMDLLEANGVIGPALESKPREVLQKQL